MFFITDQFAENLMLYLGDISDQIPGSVSVAICESFKRLDASLSINVNTLNSKQGFLEKLRFEKKILLSRIT